MNQLRSSCRTLVAASLLAVCGLTALDAHAAEVVLTSDATSTANDIRDALEEHTGIGLGPVRVVSRRVIIPTQAGNGSFEILAPGAQGTATVHGTLRVPPSYPASELTPLVERLSRITPPLQWKAVEKGAKGTNYLAQAQKASQLQKARLRTVELRRGRTAPPLSSDTQYPERFRFSRWLESPELVQPPEGDEEHWKRLKEAIRSFPNVEPGVFGEREKVRGAPKLWAFAALAADRRGHRAKALAYADVATRFARPDADALGVWERLTQNEANIPDDAFSGFASGLEPVQQDTLAYILVIVGMLAWLWVVRRESRNRFIFALLAGLSAAIAFVAISGGSNSSSKLEVPKLPDSLQAPLAGGDCIADPMLWSPAGYTVFATCRGQEVSFEVSVQGDSDVTVEALGANVGPVAEAARGHLLEVFEQAINAGWRLNPRPPDAGPGGRRAVNLSASDRLERGLTAMLAVLAFLMLFVVGRGCVGVIRSTFRRDPKLVVWLAGLAVLGVLAHLVIASRMVMVYTGYDLTTRLAGLDSMPRYGAGAIWIYEPAFFFFGVSHEALQWTNRLLGALTILPSLALLLSMVPRSRWGALLMVACVGLLPVFLRDHTSEGIQAGTLFFLAMGLAGLMLGVRRGGNLWMTWAALPILLFVATCRPEALVALPVVALGLLVSRRPWSGIQPRTWFVLGAVALTWMLPHVGWLLNVTESLVVAEDISPLDGLTAERIARVWMQDNIFMRFTWVPWTIPLLAFWAFRAKGQRALTLGWIAAALAWIAVTSVDLPDVSIPRVHLPALFLVLPAAGLGLELLRRNRALLATAMVTTVVWAAGTSVLVLESTNGDAEEELIQKLHDELVDAGEGACVARVGLDDMPPAGRTPRYFPEYLFPDQALMPLKDIGGARASCEKGTWVLLGTRCYMRDPDLNDLQGEDIVLDICERVRRDYDLDPILELKLPHRPHSTLPMYPDIDTIEVGLYRLSSVSGNPPP